MGFTSFGSFVLWGLRPSGVMSYGVMSYRVYVLRGLCPTGFMSFGSYVLWGLRPSGVLSYGVYVLQELCPMGLCLTGFMFFGGYVLRGLCPSEVMCGSEMTDLGRLAGCRSDCRSTATIALGPPLCSSSRCHTVCWSRPGRSGCQYLQQWSGGTCRGMFLNSVFYHKENTKWCWMSNTL